jgi:hypothetical protein
MAQAIGLSSTEIGTWKRCPRKWLIEYYYGFLPADEVPTGNRNVGIRWHTAMEGRYGYGLDTKAVLGFLYREAIERCPDFEAELRKEWELSNIMADGYEEWVAEEGADANLRVAGVEAEVRVPLPGYEGAVDLRAKMDQIVLDTQTGLLSFLDHKSADNFRRPEIIELDPQMATYSLIQWLASGQPLPLPGQPVALRDGVPAVMGGIVRTARRVKRTSKSKPPYYHNHPFRFDQEKLAATYLHIRQAATEILHARQQLDSCGGDPAAVQWAQLTVTRPVPLLHDCSWSCPLASGLCGMMDRGMGWMEALTASGRYVQGDPYAYYSRPGAGTIAAQLAAV